MSRNAPRPVLPDDLAWVHALNQEHKLETSSLTPERLAQLVDMAWYAKAAGDRGAFLIAFDQKAPYENGNFAWMQARFDRFVYIDRVIVARSHQRQGLARILYEDLIAQAMAADYPRVTCEVNAAPPNPSSDAFHARMGFAQVGDLRALTTEKTVRYLEKGLT